MGPLLCLQLLVFLLSTHLRLPQPSVGPPGRRLPRERVEVGLFWARGLCPVPVSRVWTMRRLGWQPGLTEASPEFTATRTGALSWLLGACLGSLGSLGSLARFRLLEGPRQQGLTSALLSLVLSCVFTPHFTGLHLISVRLLTSRPSRLQAHLPCPGPTL